MAKLREKEKIDLGPIFNGLEGSRIASDDGSPSFHAYACEEYLTVLESFIDFSEKLPEAVKKRLISQSLFAVANAGTITAKRFEQELKKQERDYLAQPVNSYKFWTTLSLGHTFRQESISVDGKTFHFRASSPPDLTREPFDFATPVKGVKSTLDP